MSTVTANNASAMSMTCAKSMKTTSSGAFQGDNPLHFALPLLILQICIVVVLTRALAFLLKPLRQPRVIAEIIGGILLGPSALGRSSKFLNTVFPKSSLTVLDTIANIGLLFFLFLVGLELDLRAIRRTGKRALAIALAGISLPFVLGVGTSVVLRSKINKGVHQGPFLVFMGVALSITAFPVLARILAELKLLTTDLGRMAMSAAAVNDVAAWVLLAVAVALSGDGSPIVSLWILLTGAAFIIAVSFLVRPVLAWMARRSLDGEPVKEIYICATLTTVLAAGFVTDVIGIHALFGAFVIGIVVPKDGPFAGVLIEKLEDLISGLFLPLYFVSSGLKTNVARISGRKAWGLLALVITNACLGKILGTVLAALLVKVPIGEAIALGFLMNTKGLVELIVLNIGKERNVLNDETFAILVLMALVTTFITTPVVMTIYKPARRLANYKHRTIERPNKESELRILACFHGNRNIPAMINLVESSRGTRRRGITVFAMHLMELSERSSAISMVHKARQNGLPFWPKTRKHSGGDQIVVAFEAYQQLSSVSIRPATAISDLGTIHEDIIAGAQDKRVALILLPFHKLQNVDGTLESFGTVYQQINQRVQRLAPCSVAVLVDRGLGGTSQVAASDVSYTATMLFFGGPDDREALAYSARMAEHPGIALTVVRFTASAGSSGATDENAADEASVTAFRTTVAATNSSVKYEEMVFEETDQVVLSIKGLRNCSLFLVGRTSPMDCLGDKSRSDYCPELGPVGSYLVSPELSTRASVLVMQKYNQKVDPSKIMEDAVGVHDVPDTPLSNIEAGSRPTP